jgi:hypothetical protein
MRKLPSSRIDITPVMFLDVVTLAEASSGDGQQPDSGSANATFLPVRRPSWRSGVVSSGVGSDDFLKHVFVVSARFDTPMLSEMKKNDGELLKDMR